jgi:hypothetical protein
MAAILAEAKETGSEQVSSFDRPDNVESYKLLPKDALPSPVLVREMRSANANEVDDKTGWEKLKVRPLVRFSSFRPPTRKFETLQQFEGIVTSVDSDSVWADLHDLTNPSSALEVVEIPLKEFSIADRQLLTSGSAFYWIIGYDTSPAGTIRRTSEIRVRRTAKWSNRKVESLKSKAREMLSSITNAKDEQPS